MIRLDNISVSYSGIKVLSGVSLEVKRGERIAITGASGSGKTTLLKVLAGLLIPEEGRIFLKTKNPAVVFQESRLLTWRTAAENVNLILGDKQETMEKALSALSLVGLESDAGKYPNEMSGGMKQRVAIARAIAFDAELFILDEPFKEMDITTKQNIMSVINEKSVGKTVVLVTHDIEEAELLNCKVLEMHNI